MYNTFFKTIQELHDIVSVDLDLDLNNILPDIHYVEHLHIKPLLSSAYFTALLERYQSDTLTATEEVLVDRIQAASANLAVCKYTPRGTVKVSNAGLKAFETENEKTPRQWQLTGFKKEYQDRGFALLDDMLAFLEENKDDYPGWAGSAAYTASKKYFINTATAFDDIIPIGCSRRLFLKLRSHMARAEDFIIKKEISQPLFDQVKEQIKTDTLSFENEKLLELVQKAVAYQSIATALVFVSLNINADGVFVIDNENTKTIDASKPAEMDRLAALRQEYESTAAEYVGQIRELINTDPENEYPLYFNSSAYVVEPTAIQFENLQDNGVFFLS